ncbi:MAG: AbrB/MazE/SpoVT family DNA-binding domain-containing protein [Nanobdellota archaeon]
MEFRKLIKFGSNSFVVSIPKTWLDTYNLGKGDTITLEPAGDSLILSPAKEKQKEEKVITITVKPNSTPRTLKRELLSAYEHNATTIYFTGTRVSEHTTSIISLIDSLTGLEIVEHTTNKIIAKTYIKTEDITIETFLKRVDNSIKSMILEIAEELEGNKKINSKKLKNEISQREQNVDKIVRLLQRAIRERLYMQVTSDKNNDPLTLLRFWQMITLLETVSDNLERLSQELGLLLKEEERKKMQHTLITIKNCFEKVMNAFYTKNTEQAYKVSDTIRELKEDIEKKNNEKNFSYLLQKLEENINIISEINKLSY